MPGQCVDDSLTSDVPKKEVMLFKLGGAPECHAPELAQELRAAKAEVGDPSLLVARLHAVVQSDSLPCAEACRVLSVKPFLLARHLIGGNGTL